MTMIQNIGLFGLNLLIGWANDYSHAGPDNPSGYNLGMWIFSSLGFLGVLFAFPASPARDRPARPRARIDHEKRHEIVRGYQITKIATLNSEPG